MDDRNSVVHPPSGASDRWWRLRAAGRGLLRGAGLGALCTGLPFVASVLWALMEWSEGQANHQQLDQCLIASFVAAGCTVVSAVLFAVAAALGDSRRSEVSDAGPDFGPRGGGARSFDDSLSHYLADATSSNVQRASTSASRMRFFSLRLPDRRHGPRSTSTIREILARIHRLLSGG